MRTSRAAVLWEVNQPWQVEDVEIDDPVAGEVLVRLTASGMCHSDEHVLTGDLPAPLPMIGGHEGAGVVEQVGEGVTDLAPGDHVVLSFIPSCGVCHWCSTGHQNLCDLGIHLLGGVPIANGVPRIRAKGQGLATMVLLGTFCEHVVVHHTSAIKIDTSIPLDKAALLGCGVVTGWGSAVYAGEVGAGDTVVVVGTGGVGCNAVQGAKMAGATQILAVDPVEFKRSEAIRFGATHVAPSIEDAVPLLADLTVGQMAEVVILTTSVAEGRLIGPALGLAAKNGRLVITAVAPVAQNEVTLNLFELAMLQKDLRGCLFGSGNPRADVPKLLNLYRSGNLMLDELITRTYTLDQINEGYQDMRDGLNIRGIIRFD